jgi:hypothetical protein
MKLLTQYGHDPEYCYHLLKLLYNMPSATRAWFQTMNTFLKQEDCTKVGYEESMWKTTLNGHDILLADHIDDFLLVCHDRTTLDVFRAKLLDHFDGSYEGDIKTYLGCEIERDMVKGLTSLSQTIEGKKGDQLERMKAVRVFNPLHVLGNKMSVSDIDGLKIFKFYEHPEIRAEIS